MRGTDETCTICLEDYEDGEELRVLPCEHRFHAACIDPWLTTRVPVCPVCKMDVRADLRAKRGDPEGVRAVVTYLRDLSTAGVALVERIRGRYIQWRESRAGNDEAANPPAAVHRPHHAPPEQSQRDANV